METSSDQYQTGNTQYLQFLIHSIELSLLDRLSPINVVEVKNEKNIQEQNDKYITQIIVSNASCMPPVHQSSQRR